MSGQTQADFWFGTGSATWRKCRKPFACHGLGGSLPANQCDHEVQAGERYLDTGELTDWPNTVRMCADCAAKPAKSLKPAAGAP